ncbi:ferric reductase-like transmembrane domain-containing protein [Kiloniella antarctica]|uniref:Ferric reductase-like transmembrane domain-containing protein n=1 Tax=Kiloniella antarctica TaxID=1550907 RepID=A0ABW5BR77_9PROT
MRFKKKTWIYKGLIWSTFTTIIAVPIVAAMCSPLLAWRDPIYIIAGLAGVIAMALLFVQPVLAGGYLRDLSRLQSRQVHRIIGGILVMMILIHVIGLWITSPPDVIDALLFSSPTPFSVWGVIAMWALFASALTVLLRHRLRINPRMWRFIHTGFAVLIVPSSVIHALLIIGTMETTSKRVLCGLVVAVTAKVIVGWWRLPAR